MGKMNLFRAPCGAAGLYNQDTVIQAYCGASGDATSNCDTCFEQCRCEYMSVLGNMPYGFSWEAVCGWEAAEEREAMYAAF